jgi:hypothetical protein
MFWQSCSVGYLQFAWRDLHESMYGSELLFNWDHSVVKFAAV